MQESGSPTAAAPVKALTDTQIATWVKAQKDDLRKLAIIVQQSNRLHTLRIRAQESPSLLGSLSEQDYLPPPTIQAFLSAENLHVLSLDLSRSFQDRPRQQGSGTHICPAIGAALRTLQSIQIRLPSICSDIIKPPDPNESLRLSVVVINLSLSSNLPGITSAAHSKRCGSVAGGLLQLQAEIQNQAQALIAQMTSPQTMRILTHSLPQFEKRSFDVLTGKTMILDDDMAWNEDGRIVVEDSEPESDFSDDESVT
jgi:hypothetical protein